MSTLDLRPVIEALRSVLPEQEFIGLHEPKFSGNEWAYVKECLDTGWVSSVGKFVDQFEATLAEYTDAKYAVATVNGTAALHVCLRLAGVEAGDEVLIPTLTFIATANAVSYCNAIPHFIDSEDKTLGVDAARLGEYLESIAEMRDGACVNRSTGRTIRAVVPMHTFGHPVDLDALVTVCEKWNITLIEDAAESLGSFYKGRHTGTTGRLSALSFNGNKVITTGGGGAILTNDEALAKQAKHITTTAKKPHRWEYNHDQIGYNYRLPNINAALGCAQLEQLPGFLEKKRALAIRYKDVLQSTPGVQFFVEPEFAHSNYWLNAILLEPEYSGQRDELLDITNSSGIMTRPVWQPMHKLTMFENCPRMELPVAQSLEQRLVNIPSSVYLGEEYSPGEQG